MFKTTEKKHHTIRNVIRIITSSDEPHIVSEL